MTAFTSVANYTETKNESRKFLVRTTINSDTTRILKKIISGHHDHELMAKQSIEYPEYVYMLVFMSYKTFE